MAIVLYALGVGLIGWSGYLLASGDSYAALDIATRLAGWGVFAIGLGAIASALRRLTRAVEASGRGGRRDAATAASPFEALKRGALFNGPSSDEPAATEPRLAEPPHTSFGAPAVDIAPLPPRAAPSVIVATPSAEQRRLEPEPELEAAAAPEPTPVPAPEPEAPGGPIDETPVAPESEASSEAEAEPEAGDDADAALSKKERRQRRREAKQREEAFERPQVVAPLLGGGQLFAGRERRLDTVGPVAPPMERAERPVFRTQEPASFGPEPDAALGPAIGSAPEIEPVERPDTPSAEDERASAPEFPEEPRLPVDAERDEAEAPKSAASKPERPKAADSAAPEPKVPEWLARARARREARAALEKPPVEEEVPAKPPAIPEVAAAEPEPEAPEVEVAHEAVSAAHEPEANAPDAAQNEPQGAPAVDADSVDEPVAEPQLVREGEHRGVTYRFFDDGSVEALSPHGSRRFSTVEELRATVIAARGPGYAEPDSDSAPYDAPQTIPATSDQDPLEAALSELEGERSGQPPTRRG